MKKRNIVVGIVFAVMLLALPVTAFPTEEKEVSDEPSGPPDDWVDIGGGTVFGFAGEEFEYIFYDTGIGIPLFWLTGENGLIFFYRSRIHLLATGKIYWESFDAPMLVNNKEIAKCWLTGFRGRWAGWHYSVYNEYHDLVRVAGFARHVYVPPSQEARK